MILYFNVGMKAHQQVKEEMDRFMREVAPAFEGKHLAAARGASSRTARGADLLEKFRARNLIDTQCRLR